MKMLRHFKTSLEVNVTKRNRAKKIQLNLKVSYQNLNLNLTHKKY